MSHLPQPRSRTIPSLLGGDAELRLHGAPRDVLAGYRKASLGRVRAGVTAVERALASLEQGPTPDAPAAASLGLLAGEVQRRAGRWDAAAASYFRAARALSGQRELAGAALALAVESSLMPGSIARAEERLAAFLDEGHPGKEATLPATAVLELYRGRASEARAALRALPEELGDRWAGLWLDLLRAEVLLEMGALPGAEQALGRAAQRLDPRSRFSEAHLRYRLLRASADVLALSVRTTEESDANASVSARRSLRRLGRYAHAFPLYRAWHRELVGEHALLAKGEADAHFATASDLLEKCGAVSSRARVLVRQVLALRKAEERASGPRGHEARELLLEMGADARLGQLAGRTGQVQVQAARRSVAMRLEGVNLTEEAGLEAVFEVSRHLSSVRKLDELFEKVLDSIVRVMKADRGVLLRLGTDDSLTPVAARGLTLEQAQEDGGVVSFGVVREAERTGEPVMSDNAMSDERFRERASVMATDIRSVVCSPIRTAHRTLGFVYLDRRLVDVAFDASHLDLLGAFCVQVAVAWENALAFEEIEHLNLGLEQKVKERTLELREANERLAASLEELTNTRLRLAEAQRDALETEMQLARDIQRSILPEESVISLAGLDVIGTVVPASYCGGDFWSFVHSGGARTLLVVADVTGHGVAASLITAVMRACLDTLVTGAEIADVTNVLAILNRVIWGSARGQLCATCSAILVSSDERSLTFASAGHNPPWLLEPDEAPRPLMQRGYRLGEAEDATFQATTTSYKPGARLALYTDGIVEWRNAADRDFGDRRLRKSLDARRSEPLAEALTGTIADAEAFAAGVERDDDLTLILADLL